MRRWLLVALLVALGVSACLGRSNALRSDAQLGSRVSPPAADVTALARDSDLVVLARPRGEATAESVNGAPFMVQEFAVTESLKGDAGPTVRVRMEGRPAEQAWISTRRQYVLFLYPFEFERGVPTGQWYVSGAGVDGLFAVDGDEAVRVKDGDASPGIPKRLPLETLLAKARG